MGIYKPKYLPMQKSATILNLYKQIKSVFDPNGIMNPYKVVSQQWDYIMICEIKL